MTVATGRWALWEPQSCDPSHWGLLSTGDSRVPWSIHPDSGLSPSPCPSASVGTCGLTPQGCYSEWGLSITHPLSQEWRLIERRCKQLRWPGAIQRSHMWETQHSPGWVRLTMSGSHQCFIHFKRNPKYSQQCFFSPQGILGKRSHLQAQPSFPLTCSLAITVADISISAWMEPPQGSTDRGQRRGPGHIAMLVNLQPILPSPQTLWNSFWPSGQRPVLQQAPTS